ncbi:hypothetical protein DFP72DRAFT_901738 [Ephemerocybe angulata]|uniref:MYND-type domain-containing protein n=1 Tax=Ephemerocybe angulata TaxID=980116 RepID=A0A8H6M613_9AGAR|nr:hypothetical protein DFP72DRAFT_901738 [Tulosesus angulatus]
MPPGIKMPPGFKFKLPPNNQFPLDMRRGCGVNEESIRRARKPNNLPALITLTGELTPENFVLDVVDAVLLHVHPIPFKRPKKGEDYPLLTGTHQISAWCTRVALYTLTYRCPSHHFDGMIAKILPKLDMIMDWLLYLTYYPNPVDTSKLGGFQFNDPIKPCFSIVHMACNASLEIRKQMFSTPKIVDFTLRAWTLQNKGVPYVLLTGPNARCPVSTLFSFIMAGEGRFRVYDVLLCRTKEPDGKALRSLAIENLVKRADEARRMELRGGEVEQMYNERPALHSGMQPPKFVDPGIASAFLETVLSIAASFFMDENLSRLIMKSDFFQIFTEALETWVLSKSKRGPADRQARVMAFRVASRAQDMVEEYGAIDRRLSIAVHRKMLSSGLIPVMIEGMQTIRREDKETTLALSQMMDRTKRLVEGYPKVAPEVDNVLKRHRGARYRDHHFLSGTGWEAPWIYLCRSVETGCGVEDGIWDTTACDNLGCPTRHVSPPTPIGKVCAGCHTMSYCGAECQKADWKAQHREECRKAREAYDKRKVSGNLHYTQTLRRRHLEFACRSAAYTYSISGTNHKSVLRIDLYERRSVPIEEYLKVHGLSDQVEGDPSELTWDQLQDRRIQRLVKYYAEHGEKENLALAEMQFRCGDHTVFTLVLIQNPFGNGEPWVETEFWLYQCITRILVN